MSDRLRLMVEGEAIDGWTAGQVSMSMDSFASSFRFDYHADRSRSGDRVIIEAGDAVEVYVEDELVLAGYVDADETTVEPGKERRTVTGRSKLGDLVDCSAFHESARFRDISLIDLATELSAPYGIAIYDRTEAVEPLDRWKLRDGSTIADELNRAAKARGQVLIDEAGDLVIARAGESETRTVLRDTNTLRGRRLRSWESRFSEYVIKSKRRRRDEDTGAPTTIRKTVEDEGVSRFRRLVVHGYGDKQTAVDKRAILERNVRFGRSERFTYTVPGWRTNEGTIWRPNTLVKVEDPSLGIDANMILVGVELQHRIDVHRATLELTLPQAFDQVITLPTRRRGETRR